MPEPDTPMAVPNASPTNSNQQHHKKHTVPLVYSPRSMSPPHMVTRHPGGSYSSPHLYSSPHPYHRHATSYVSSIPYPVSPPTHTSARSFEAAIPMVEGDPPEASHQDKARKATTAAERSRAATLEAQEVTLTADAVRIILRQERRRAAKLAADLAAHKASAVQLQLAAEVCEEGRINGLMRQVDNLTHEKERVIVELEREEEMLTNTLQRKLQVLQHEKAVLGRQMEYEKEENATLRFQLSVLREAQLKKAAPLEDQEEMEEE